MPDQLFSFEGKFITLAQINRIKQERKDAEKKEERVIDDVVEKKEEKSMSEFEILMEKTRTQLESICIEKGLEFKDCKNKTEITNLILS